MSLLTMTRRKPSADALAARREAELDAADTAEWLAELAAGQAALDERRREAERRARAAARLAAALLDAVVDELLEALDGMTQAEVRDALRADRDRWARPFAGAPLDDVLAAVMRRDVRAGRDRVVLLARAAGCRGSQADLHAAYRRLRPAGPAPKAL